MIYHILADLVVAIHLAYVGYVVVGELLILVGIALRWQWIRNPWFRVSHLVMILFVVYEVMIGMQCPLTTWEDQLVEASGQTADGRSFVGRLMDSILHVDLPAGDPMWNWIYGSVGAVILLSFVVAPPRFRRWRRHMGTLPKAQ